jgi:hypothetical protein
VCERTPLSPRLDHFPLVPTAHAGGLHSFAASRLETAGLSTLDLQNEISRTHQACAVALTARLKPCATRDPLLLSSGLLSRD